MEFPIKEILIFVFGGGAITGLIALSKEIRERVAQKKKEKLDENAAHLSSSVEMQRLENESDNALWERLNEENKRLNAELKLLRESPSLSFSTTTNMYKCYRELGVRIDKHETRIIRDLPHSDLLESLNELKAKYDDLGTKMP